MTTDRQEGQPLVLVVDDDKSVRDALVNLLQSVGYRARTFGSTAEMLAATLPDVPTCLVLDIRLPGESGLDFQKTLSELDNEIPIIFISGHGDIPMSVRAMKAGAIEFLTKPFREQDLLDAVRTALDMDLTRRDENQRFEDLRHLYLSLTAREAEVLPHVTAGLMNKQIAGELGISEVTVKVHRGNIMRKMGVRTLPDLVRIADVLRLNSAEDGN